MGETLPGETKPRVMNGRNVALVCLGIICIMLLASLIYSVETVESGNNQISELQNENALLERQIGDLNSILNFSQIDLWKWNENTSLAPMTNYSWNYSANYAGYVFLQVSPNQNSTYNIHLRLVWSYKNGVLNYDNTTNGFIECAILPCSNVTITLSNADLTNGFSGTLYFVYTY